MKKILYLCFALFILTSVNSTLYAKNFWHDDDIETLRKKSDKGDAKAQFHLGSAYAYGQEVEKDYTEAFKWYKKSADNGYLSAIASVASCYLKGRGVEQNIHKCIFYLTQAADKAYGISRYNLMEMYLNGQYVKEDLLKSFDYLNYAQRPLDQGLTCLLGEGVEKDIDKAIVFFLDAIRYQGDDIAARIMEKLYLRGMGVKQDYQKAFEFGKIAKGKLANKFFFINQVIQESKGNTSSTAGMLSIPKDKSYDSFENYKKMRLHDNELLYKQGTGKDIASIDPEKRLEVMDAYLAQEHVFMTELASLNNPRIRYHVAKMYLNGDGIEKNVERAISLFKYASKIMYLKANYDIGNIYLKGEDIEQNYEEAFKWYKKAADKYHLKSLMIVGQMYQEGKGCTADSVQALKYFDKAAMCGVKESFAKIGLIYQESNDLVKAYSYFYMGNILDDKEATILKNKMESDKTISDKQINEAEKSAKEWLEKYLDKKV